MTDAHHDSIAATLNAVRQVLADDARTPLDELELDHAVWDLLSEPMHPAPASDWPEWARHFVAQRWVEGDIGNGGLDQAMLNVPDWFELAAHAYAAQGLHEMAQLLRDAAAWLAQQTPQPTWQNLQQLPRAVLRAMDELCDRVSELGEDHWNVSDRREAQLRALHANGAL